MADPRYPAAVWRPGVNADNGHTTMESTVCHYTVGKNSQPIGDQGYFHFLISRDGTVTQFARADAVCWHAGDPWNGRGPGIEVEYLDEPTIFTPEAEAACGALCQWLTSEWGIPDAFYDGPRITAFNGYITHRSLIQTGDYHNDYWPYLPTAPAPTPPAPRRQHKMIIVNTDEKGFFTYTPELGHFQPVADDVALYLMSTGLPNVKIPWATALDWAAQAETRIKALAKP